ncbi:MAG: gliding motility protein GldL [Muribaculaceae bacterium]|nr:gliding motility protein GldL [Muribaculaceae bacterium]
MKNIRRYTNRIEEFLHSDNGQRFFNIAYSVGAAIVIWGALFKILHLPGGNTLLCIGMGTEIAMFLLTAFDRPPKEPNWEEIVPALNGKGNQSDDVEQLTVLDDNGEPIHGVGGGTVILGGGNLGGGSLGGNAEVVAGEFNNAAGDLTKANELVEATNRFAEAIEGISKQMSELHETLSTNTSGYARHMEDLNRNLMGLNTIYEIQLRSMSGQLDAIDRVNRGLKDIRDMYEKSATDSAKYCEESEKMTHYMQQINAVYAKMIAALTINPLAQQSAVNQEQ